MARGPRVDVVVPCYNYGHFVETCVKSVTSQTGVDVRVLIIDDCSTDGSQEVVASIAEHDSRVTARIHTTNQGHIATYNEGLLDWADGDYLVLLSADDLLAPGSLSRATSAMEAAPNIGFVYGHAPYFQSIHDLPTLRPRTPTLKIWSGTEWISDRCRSGYNVISSPEVVVRGAVQRRVGGYRPELPHSGDLEMWLRIASVSDVAYVGGMPQAYYRVHDSSMQRSVFSDAGVDLLQRRQAFDTFFETCDQVPGYVDELRRTAHRQLASQALWRAASAYDRGISGAADLVEFAISTSPDAATTSGYRALERRKRLGPRVCSKTHIFGLSALARRAQYSYRFKRWQWTGR
jgi:glycosyltransferase involved in cell wall biosynthesis